MPLPRPAHPRVLWNDLRAFWTQRPRHHWWAGMLAVIIPIGLVVAFYFDAQTNIRPVRTIIYLDSWPADRTDEQIRARQEADAATMEARAEERRRQFQRLDSQLNRLGI